MTNDKTPKLSLEAYKGTRDFYPEDQFVQNYIFGVWRKVCARFGYEEYHASILEEAALYRAKSGEEIVNEQTYTFTDRGGREVTLRPEMTPTVARLVAQKRNALTFPVRWFTLPNLFRYEKPQRGRVREHWQLNADIFGAPGSAAEVEVIGLAYAIMLEFGAKPEDFVIKINSRRILNELLRDVLALDEASAHRATKLIDRMHKMPREDFSAALLEIAEEKTELLTQALDARSVADLPEPVLESASVRELSHLLELLGHAGVQNAAFDPSLVRGFDYYTGTVFEVFDTHPKNSRSVFGGGRYDDLVGMFGVEPVTAFGFGMGDVTIRDFLETRELLPKHQTATVLYLAHLSPEELPFAQSLAAELRAGGLNVTVDVLDRKVSAQVKAADRSGVPYVLVVGPAEVASNSFKVKHLPSGQEHEVPRAELARFLAQGR